MRRQFTGREWLGLAVAGSSLASVGFWVAGAISNQSSEYGYLIWNLFLAWIPLGLALWVESMLRVRAWSSWWGLFATALWLGFLPNSFYVISDFVHLGEVPRVDLVFDVVMFASFGFSALIVGYLSLLVIHKELRKRLTAGTAGAMIGAILLLSSFAIYIGRDLRWNTWDVLANPASLIFDVSDRVLNIGAHPQVLSTTLSFFVLLGSVYLVILGAVRALRPTGVANEPAHLLYLSRNGRDTKGATKRSTNRIPKRRTGRAKPA